VPTRSLLAFVVVVVAQVTYHLAQKVMPPGVQAFAALTVVYALSTVACLAILLASGGTPVLSELRASFVTPTLVLAAAVVGIEAGFLYLYRTGGALSTAYAATGAGTILVLFLVGTLWLREPVTARQLTGVLLAATGIVLATLR
jgi:drug/metabolite transporter (DMT)-like permease